MTTTCLRTQLADLQRRNALLKKLQSVMQLASSTADSRDDTGVISALRAAKKSGELATDVLERIVNEYEHTQQPKCFTDNDTREIDARDDSQTPLKFPPPLRLGELGQNHSHGGRASGSQTAREFGGSAAMRSRKDLLEPLEHSERYRTLLVALNLATPSPTTINLAAKRSTENSNENVAMSPEQTPQAMRNTDGKAVRTEKSRAPIDAAIGTTRNTARQMRTRTSEGVPLVRRKFDFEAQKQSNAGSVKDFPSTWLHKAPTKERPTVPRRHAARQRTKSLPVTQVEIATASNAVEQPSPRRLSLPSSPQWTDDMNPGHQPDGEFSREMRKAFNLGVRSLLRPLRFGGTALQVKVKAKRSKQATQMWEAVRMEAATCSRIGEAA